MSLSRQATPEVFFTETEHRVDTYHNLSVGYAQAGDSLMAVNSMWAADVATVQMIAWERVVIASPNPDKKFFEIASVVAVALSSYAVSTAGVFRSAQEAVESARKGLESAFDESFLKLLRVRYKSTAHLSNLPAPTPSDVAKGTVRRLGGLDPAQFVASRYAEARAAAVASQTAAASGDINGAIEQAYNSDMLAFEAYLVQTAVAVGDTGLLTVPLRLDIAGAYIAELPGLPYDLGDAVTAIRGALARAIGPAESKRFDTALTQL